MQQTNLSPGLAAEAPLQVCVGALLLQPVEDGQVEVGGEDGAQPVRQVDGHELRAVRVVLPERRS